jgi:predicted CXXCH cytochrome family protein
LVRLLVCGLLLALLSLRSTPSPAGEYHVGATLYCGDCHNASAGTIAGPLKASPNRVCLSCHDGQPGIPDVMGSDVNAGHGPRQAGGLPSGEPGYGPGRGHLLESQGPPPGGAWPSGETQLQCVSCHAAHGNGNYRNLGGRLSQPPRVSYVTSTVPTNAVDVRIDLAAVPPVGERVAAGFYSATRTYFNRPSTSGSGYGAFCATCHRAFASAGVRSPFRLHPVETVGLSPAMALRYNRSANKLQLLAPSNASSTVYGASASLSCMTCHRAHGNRNPFAMLFMKPTGVVTEQGVEDAVLRDLCVQCHPVGS